MPAEEELPRKPYYTIGEVSRITGVRPHVLRYWESQGKILRPNRKRSRHRLYRLTDIQLILEIKRLRDEEKLSLAAMRRRFQPRPAGWENRPPPAFPLAPGDGALALLHSIREELLAIKALLK